MITIRAYEARDLDACRGLWEELTEWHRQIYEAPSIGGPEPGLQFDEHLARVRASNVWVAEADGHVVGMAGLIESETEAELEPLSVSEAYRGRGIGSELARVVIAAARERGFRTLVVHPVARNVDAIRIFRTLGFDVLGQIELMMDLDPEKKRRWMSGERLAGREFRF